jgi:transposase
MVITGIGRVYLQKGTKPCKHYKSYSD